MKIYLYIFPIHTFRLNKDGLGVQSLLNNTKLCNMSLVMTFLVPVSSNVFYDVIPHFIFIIIILSHSLSYHMILTLIISLQSIIVHCNSSFSFPVFQKFVINLKFRNYFSCAFIRKQFLIQFLRQEQFLDRRNSS